MVSFPAATSKEVLDIHLTNLSADTAKLHVRVIFFLEDNSHSKVENIRKNLKAMVEKCHTYGITNVFISGLLYTTRISLPFLERTHEMIEHLCNKLDIC